MRYHDPTRRRLADDRPRPGFTLIELLFVIGVIGLTIGLALPAINALTEQIDTSTGVNAINTGITAARAVAVDPDQGARFVEIDGTSDGEYSGAAMIVTPAGELRFAINIPYAKSTGGNYLEIDFSEENNGYDDKALAVRNIDAVQLPANAGVLGIIRTDTSEPALIPPPFGVRFNQDGHLIPCATTFSGANATKMILYDGNGDGAYDRGALRTSTYNADNDDPEYGSPSRTSDGYWAFDIEVFESVAGVVVYDEGAFRNAGHNLISSGSAQTLNNAARQWLLRDDDGDGKPDNATVIFFNRYSGVIFSERDNP